MSKLEGIIYKTFEHYVVLRGFASIKDLAAISHKPKAYQRPALASHKKDIINFLDSGEYKYFPEITLACRVQDYTAFAANIGIENAIERDDAKYVTGLKVLSQRLPYEGYRARHANLTKNNNRELVRVDGNHRLEPFDDPQDSDTWNSSNIQKSSIEKLIVPYTVIFSEKEFGDKFEAGIFHNINFKQLPLRQESSLKIISELGVFEDKEKLGDEYPLAIELIDILKGGIFDDIYWLSVNTDISNTYYRTSCLRIAQLLLSRKSIIIDLKNKEIENLKNENGKIKLLSEEIKRLEENITLLKDKQSKFEIDNPNFDKLSTYKECVKDLVRKNKLLDINENDKNDHIINRNHILFKIKKYQKYLKSCQDTKAIIEAIQSIRYIYNKFEKDQYGNIAMLVTMVYYSLLDTAQLNSFVSWAIKNGVNKVTEADDLSMDASDNLIKMFEQIFQSKKNEIFISMQFGDAQSELIYEKIVRAIETFNNKHKSIYLSAKPIRIDRTIESSTYTIQNRILKAIESCSLIIADLSSANINVYHEIGYAMGVAQSNHLLPNMILLYKENTDHNKVNADIDKFIGFNLRSLSQLRFRDYKQLVDGLVERLEKHYGV